MRLLHFIGMETEAAAAAAKSLQLCLTLCDSIDGSPPGSPVPGILQAKRGWDLNPRPPAYHFVQFSSVAHSCPTLCDPMDCSMPGFPVHHNSWSLLKLMSIDSVMPSNFSSSIIPFSSRLQSFPASGSFPMSQFFTLGGQSIGVSASASVLPKTIQD